MLTKATTGRRPGRSASDLRAGTALSGGLGTRLRAETRIAHETAEAAMDLSRRLASAGSYGSLLLLLDGFQRACEPALRGLAGELPAELRDGPARRRDRIDADLRALGVGRAACAVCPSPVPGGPDGALGAFYVLEGAALGGLLIAAEVRRRLPGATGATRFFSGEGRRTAARWRAVQAVLDGWGRRRGEDCATAVVAGADATFGGLTELLRATA